MLSTNPADVSTAGREAAEARNEPRELRASRAFYFYTAFSDPYLNTTPTETHC